MATLTAITARSSILTTPRSNTPAPDINPYSLGENEMTAHFPFQAHFLAPESPPPPSMALNFSSTPSSSPTTTSALHVRSESTLTPDPGPSGPRDFVKGVVGSQATCIH